MKCFFTILRRWCKQTKNRKEKKVFFQREKEKKNYEKKNLFFLDPLFILPSFLLCFSFISFYTIFFFLLHVLFWLYQRDGGGVYQSRREVFCTLMLFSRRIMKTNDEKTRSLCEIFNNNNKNTRMTLFTEKSLCPNNDDVSLPIFFTLKTSSCQKL